MNNTLKQHARTLRLSGLLESLELRLQEAEANRLPHSQFLELLFQDEINVRHQRLLSRRHKLADFREVRSLDNFDFSFNPNTNRAQIYELATGHFVAQRRDVLLVGPPGGWQKSSRTGHRPRGAQGRLPGSLPLHLRSGARITDPGNANR